MFFYKNKITIKLYSSYDTYSYDVSRVFDRIPSDPIHPLNFDPISSSLMTNTFKVNIK